jgi:hypothetical protein
MDLHVVLTLAMHVTALTPPHRPAEPPAAAGTIPADTSSLTISVDSSRHLVTLVAGPFHVPAMDTLGDHGTAHNTPLQRFEWPVDGWIRGFDFRLSDGLGDPVPHSVLHHLIIVNFSRRALLYPMFERLIGAGAETSAVSLPATVGIPIEQGMRLGFYVGWHNASGYPLDDVYVTVTLRWLPKNLVPAPVGFLPLHIDAHETVGVSDRYDLAPGWSAMSYEFQLPIDGRLLAIGGHMHDYAVSVQLKDLKTGTVVSELPAEIDERGRILGVGRRLYGVWGDGLKLHAGRSYRITGVYNNPTGRTLVGAGMANMLGLFVPADRAEWPPVDLDDPLLQRDLASLNSFGRVSSHTMPNDPNDQGVIR